MQAEAGIPFNNLTGLGVRVAVIDSGVNPAHPHVGGVEGGVAITAEGEGQVYLDYVGHGTAVAGAIREKAPEASIFAVKVFDQNLRTTSDTIIRAIEWAIDNRMHVVNLSLGTVNQTRREQFERVVARAIDRNVTLVAAREMDGQTALPGCLDSVIGVGLDWDCPRETYRCAMGGSRATFFASGYPRAIPGVPQERNLHGISFAVANMAGFVARARESSPASSVAIIERMLIEEAASH
jgi:subtilisin family serine protease